MPSSLFVDQIEESQWSVSDKEEKLNHLVEQERALEQSFLHAIGDNNKFKDFLLKVGATEGDQHGLNTCDYILCH